MLLFLFYRPFDQHDTPLMFNSTNLLPNARLVSNQVMGYTLSSSSFVNQLFVFVGKLIQHDVLDYSSNQTDFIPIRCDAVFDVDCVGSSIPYLRPRIVNSSGYLDASFLYGAEREYSGGRLKMNNDLLLSNGSLFLAGDVRINENAALMALCTLFAREHNRKALELSQNMHWSDEILFQESRRWVIAIWQKIVFTEWVPATLGTALSPYQKQQRNISLFGLFSLNFLNSMVPNGIQIIRGSSVSSRLETILLQSTEYNNEFIKSNGIDGLLFGMSVGSALDVDLLVTSELRNQKKDLMAEMIQQTRDLKFPSYLEARRMYNLSASSIMDSTRAILQEVYSQDYDAIIGGLAESLNSDSSLVGPLFYQSLLQLFTNLRNSDDYYHLSTFSQQELEKINNFTLHELIIKNTNLKMFPVSTFQSKNDYDLTKFFVWPRDKCMVIEKSSYVQISMGVSMNWTTNSDSIIFNLNVNHTLGWFGIAFGEPMTNLDINLVQIYSNGSFLIQDMFSPTFFPVLDTQLGGKSDLYDVKELKSKSHLRVIEWKRLLNTKDAHDVEIKPNEINTFSFAYSTQSDRPKYHGIKNTLILGVFVNQQQQTSTVQVVLEDLGWDFPIKCFHGLLMLLVFGVMHPWAIYCARYQNENLKWLSKHEGLGNAALAEIIFGSIMVFVKTTKQTNHFLLGILVAVLILLNQVCGMLLKFDVKFVQRHYLFSRNVHIFLGLLNWIMGIANCFIGLKIISQNAPFLSSGTVLLGVWLLVLLMIFINAEQKLWKSTSINTFFENGVYKMKPKTAAEMTKVLNLPDFEWKDVNVRVGRGSLWLVQDGIIYDVAKFLPLHPGGVNSILSVVGIDSSTIFWGITMDFLKKKQKEHELKKLGTQLKPRKQSIPQSFQNQFEKFEKNLHFHSRLAKVRLNNFAVGILNNEKQNVERVTPKCFPKSALFLIPQLAVLTQRELISPEDGKFVFKFTFALDVSEDLWFLPGEYIALQIPTEQRVTVRHYTPIKCHFQGSLDFVIKIYQDGELTPNLARMELGEVATIRGPINDLKITNPLNDYGLYGTVGMLVGGSAVTLCLQTMDYYLKFGRRVSGKLWNRISCLVASDFERDIVYRERLEELVLQSNGAFEVNYLIRNPTSSWHGLIGLLDREKVEKTMPPPVTLIRAPAFVDDDKFGSFRRVKKQEPIDEDYAFSPSSQSLTSNEVYSEERKLMIIVCGPLEFGKSAASILRDIGYPASDVVLM